MPEKQINVPSRAYGFPPDAYDPSILPDFDVSFLRPEDLEAFIQALSAPDTTQPPDDGLASPRSPSARSFSSFDFTKRASSVLPDDAQVVAAHAAAAGGETAPVPGENDTNNANGFGNGSSQSLFITAQSDWAPVHEKVLGSQTHRQKKGSRRRKRSKAVAPGRRTRDETREGYLYGLLKWPFLLIVGAWIVGLAVTYLFTRAYIFFYEQFVAWRGRREKLRRNMRATSRYPDWVTAARDLDNFLGNEAWKEQNEFAYYDSKTIRRVWDSLRRSRIRAAQMEASGSQSSSSSSEGKTTPIEDLKVLIEACVKNNFVGVENPRLYSQTYYGTKNLVQNYVDEVEKSLTALLETKQLSMEDKRSIFKRVSANYGRTALCLSGGASFAYYHFGVVKALLEEDLLPDVITGTSGGALVAALVATRTNEELKKLLVPALSTKITACREPISVWFRRWWSTGARFDSVDWAKQCSWWSHGSMTFREAYERTGRILNVSCVPADPHSPTILCNYLTSPDCVIWSAVLASAAVPGILNPVVLMMKKADGNLAPYSFGHKWKDGSLRTDIPIRALNLQFNVNFTIVSQVNPHINLFFFSSRGSVGQPVTHRRGRGWRGGFLGSATEQYIKLDLTKWLKVLRQLELLPRPLGQDWSQLWLQQSFGGTVTIWPKTILSDFVHILSDPDMARLARMIHEGQQSTFPKIKFISNRLRIERLIERGRRETRPYIRRGSVESIISEDDLRELLLLRGSANGTDEDVTTNDEMEFASDEKAVLTEDEGQSDGVTVNAEGKPLME
ncbi:hypothetical protein MCOR25_007360 [Pyricularia grisea]|nr:hypothetical protein MCOR25_007360 [Pyricularia grisea]